MQAHCRKLAALVASVATAIGCGDVSRRSQVLGPDEATSPPVALTKPSVRSNAKEATVILQVVNASGQAVPGIVVTLSRSISGIAGGESWSATTDTGGKATITVRVSTARYINSGAGGTYTAIAADASGAVVGSWGSIPINVDDTNVLSLPLGGRVQIHPRGPRLNVMTRNIYIGTDVNRILLPSTTPIPVLAAQAWGVVQQTHFTERADALADEIAESRPHLVGLQEVALYRIQTPGDFLAGNPVPATAVAQDFLAILLDALAARGLQYEAAAVATGTDIELPMATGPTTFSDIRLTDREVILVRNGVAIDNAAGAKFQAAVPVTIAGLSFSLPRAWVSVDATVAGRTVRFYSTHLETGGVPQVQAAQGDELTQRVLASTLPVVVVGDFNSDAGGATTATYARLVAAGLVDVFGEANPGQPGYTGSQQEDVRNPSALNHRIDLVFTRAADGLTSLDADVVGEEETDRTPSGLWPSDHAGVVASIVLPGVVPF